MIAVFSRIIVATIFSGLLAGINFDRLFVQMPAWQRLGASAWAAYSRQADIVQGIVIYPTLTLGAALPTVIAAIIFNWIGSARSIAAVPIDLAVFLVVIGLLATIKAAPIMLGLRRVENDDEVTVSKAFRGFNRWTMIRGVAQIAAFVANLLSLIALWRQ